MLSINLFTLSVSTHSRAEAAAKRRNYARDGEAVSTHSRAEAAADFSRYFAHNIPVSTHSRAEAAAFAFSDR